MLRTISVMFVLTIYGILPALAQTDAQEGRSAPIQPSTQRGMRTSPPIGGSIRPSDTSSLPAMPSASSQGRSIVPVAPPFVAEPVPVIPAKEGENGYVRTVCRLANIPANSAAGTLTKLFKTEGESVAEPIKNKVVIVPEVIGNCLFISGPPAAVEEVRRLVSEIDRPPLIVRLEVRLTQEKEPLMQAELYTLDNQLAYIQFGRQESRITNVSMSNSGVYNGVNYENVGTKIQMHPRVASGGKVMVQLDVEDSRLGSQEEGTVIFTPKDGQPIRSPNTETLTNQATLQLQDGQTQTIGAMTRNGKARRIAVTVHIIRPGTTNAAEQK